MTATEEWKPVERGWIDRCGMMTLANHGQETVEVGTEVPQKPLSQRTMLDPPHVPPVAFLKVHPGEAVPFVPADVKNLVVRSVKGTCRVTVNMFAE